MAAQANLTVLHYTGAQNDQGGIVSAIRTLAAAEVFSCVLGVSPGFTQRRSPPLPTLELPAIDAEVIGWKTWWRARAVARAMRVWLDAEPGRIFHAHSRAGLLVAQRLVASGERRVVASIHCYGRQRWFYRRASRRLGSRLFWLSPAMKRYYGIGGEDWTQCVPGGVTALPVPLDPRGPVSGKVLRLGGIGMLVSWKRWHDVIEALAALPPGVRERVSFQHIGSPDTTTGSRAYARQLRARTAALGLEGQVSWLGEQPNSDALLASVDCLLVTSQAEPFSIALLESLRAGVPGLGADSGGVVDLVRPGETGWTFRTGDVADLARAITSLVETDALARVRITPETIRSFTAPVLAGQWAVVYAGLEPASR